MKKKFDSFRILITLSFFLKCLIAKSQSDTVIFYNNNFEPLSTDSGSLFKTFRTKVRKKLWRLETYKFDGRNWVFKPRLSSEIKKLNDTTYSLNVTGFVKDKNSYSIILKPVSGGLHVKNKTNGIVTFEGKSLTFFPLIYDGLTAEFDWETGRKISEEEYLKGKETGTNIAYLENGEKIFDIANNVDSMPIYNNGLNPTHYFEGNSHYPKRVSLNDKQEVFVTLLVDTSGFVRDPRLLNTLFPPCDEEALNIIAKTNGLWKPGKHKGFKRVVRMNVRVVFTRENN